MVLANLAPAHAIVFFFFLFFCRRLVVMTVTSQCAAASVSTERWLTKVYVTLVTWTPLGLPDGGTSVSGARVPLLTV